MSNPQKAPRPFIVEEIDGKLVKRSLKPDGTPFKLRKSVGRRRHYNPSPNPKRSAIMRERNKALNERMRLIKELSGGTINPYRKGVWDGYTKETARPVMERAKREAKAILNYMKENDMVDKPEGKHGEYAEEALLAALQVMRTPASDAVKLQAARLLLDFTRSKPASKNEVTVNKAEDWLASVMADMKNDESGTS